MSKRTDKLLASGWKEYEDTLHKEARAFYKRFDTPSRCRCNSDKPGMQIVVRIYDVWGLGGIKIDDVITELYGELPDGSWVKIENYALPEKVNIERDIVPRLLAAWEAVAGYK